MGLSRPRSPENLRGWTFFCNFTLWKFTARALAAPRHRKGPSLHRFASVLAPVNKFTPQVGCIPAKFLCSRLAQTLAHVKDTLYLCIRFEGRRIIVRSAPNNCSTDREPKHKKQPPHSPVMGEERPPLIPRKGEEEEIKINRQLF